jgi:hypothetical protein
MTTVGKGECGDEGEGQKRITCRKNKHRRVLGKDLCHPKRVLLAFPLGLTYATLMLCELSFPVPFALLFSPCRPDESRRHKFFEKRRSKYNKDHITGTICHVPGLAKTVAPPKAPSKIRMGVSTKRGPISISDISGGPLGCRGSFSIIYREKTKRCDSKPFLRSKRGALENSKLLPDLEVAKPYLGIEERECEDVVDEWLCSPSLRWHAKYLLVTTQIQSKKKRAHQMSTANCLYPRERRDGGG